MTKRTCNGTTLAGNPCKANPLHDSDVCMAHADEQTRASVGFGGARAGAMGGRPKNPRVVDVIRERIEQNDEVTTTLLAALGAMKAVVVASRDEAHVEMVPDHQIRIQAARELLDRGYGRPHQSSEVTVVTEDKLVEAIERMEAELAGNDPDRGAAGDDRQVPRAAEAAS